MDTVKPALIIRALTSDKLIRLAALDMRPLWDAVRRGHPQLEADACAYLTQALGGTLLLQSRGLFVERLQVMIRTHGRANAIVADAWPDGSIRGMLDIAPNSENAPWLESPGILQVMRSNFRGEPFVAKLPLLDGDIALQLEGYLQHSEQINASMILWCDPLTGEGGGLIVEPLPNCPPERLEKLISAIDGLEVVPNWERDCEFLLRWINQGDGATILGTQEVEYRCRCSQKSLIETIKGFSPEQLEAVFPEGQSAEIRCDYCGKNYTLNKSELDSEQPGA